MRRRIAPILMSGVLAVAPLSLLVAPALAAGDGASQCVDVPAVNRHAGEYAKHVGGTDHYGIEAQFDAQFYTGLLLCTGFIPTFINSASMVWINIEGHGPGTNDGMIIQAGLLRGQGLCLPNVPTPCDGQQHYVWAWGNCVSLAGGCGGPIGMGPTPEDLGTVAFGYGPAIEIFLNCMPDDPAVCETVPSSETPMDEWIISFTDPTGLNILRAIPLWRIPWSVDPNVELRASVFCETTDNGDQCGGIAGDHYGLIGVGVMNTLHGAWMDPGFKKPCDFADTPYKCTVTWSSSVGFLTPDR